MDFNNEQIEQLKGIGYTEKQIKQIQNVMTNMYTAFNKVAEAIVKVVVPSIRKFFNWLSNYKINLLGYKRLYKAKQLKYYESISTGKSNNWRKIHGLQLIRC
jgi:uncharacterized protein YpuA (DUF1002 family)